MPELWVNCAFSKSAITEYSLKYAYLKKIPHIGLVLYAYFPIPLYLIQVRGIFHIICPSAYKPTKEVLSMAEAKTKIGIDTFDLDTLTNKIDVLTEKINTLNHALIGAKENLDLLAQYASS